MIYRFLVIFVFLISCGDAAAFERKSFMPENELWRHDSGIKNVSQGEFNGILDKIDANLDQPLTPRDIAAIYTDVEVAWLRLEEESLGWLLELGATLTDAQVGEFLAYLQKKGYTFPVGFVTPALQRVLPKPKGLPITLVRGRDGKLLQADKGQMFPEDVELLAR